MECLLERIDTCHNSPKKSSATKINKYALSGYSLFTHCSFDATIIISLIIIEVKTMEKFCEDIKKHAIKVISYKK